MTTFGRSVSGILLSSPTIRSQPQHNSDRSLPTSMPWAAPPAPVPPKEHEASPETNGTLWRSQWPTLRLSRPRPSGRAAPRTVGTPAPPGLGGDARPADSYAKALPFERAILRIRLRDGSAMRGILAAAGPNIKPQPNQ